MKRTYCIVAFFLFIINMHAQDITPPSLNGFSFTPSSIDLSGDLTINFSISASDDSSDIKKISLSFSNLTGSGSKSTSFNSIKSPSFDSEGSITLPNNSEAGEWGVSISMEDDQKNSVSYDFTELSELGFQSILTVTSSEETDVTPPVLTGFSISPTLVELPGDPVISFEVSASDDLSGIDGITVKFSPPGGGSKTERIRGINSISTTQSGAVDLGNNPAEGIWTASVTISDNEGNEINLSNADLENLGFPSSFEVVSQSDITPPLLMNFSFSPSEINVDGDETIVSIQLSAIDELSGLNDVKVSFTPEDKGGNKSLRFHNISENESVFSDELDFKSGKTGNYLVEITLEDNEKNSITYSPEDLENAGLPFMLSLVSAADTTHPRLVDFSISPDTIEINSLSHTVSYFIKVEDDTSEIKDVSINFEPPDKGGAQVVKFNNIKDKILESDGSLELKKNTNAGEWKINIEVSDKEKNIYTYTSEELSNLGFASSITVLANKDTLPPVLQSLSFSPDSMDVNESNPTISFSISVTDDLSGIDEIEISLGNKKEKLHKIDTCDFSYSSSFSLGNNLSEGELEISVSMKDNEKNSIDLSSEDLRSMGFQDKVIIESGYFIQITSPSDGATISSGNDLEIKWNQKGVKKVKLSYTTDQGNTWTRVANNINASRKSYKWTSHIASNTNVLFQIADDDNSQVSDMVSLFFTNSSDITAIPDNDELPTNYRLFQNYPNPFNPATIIRYAIPPEAEISSARNVTLTIYDLLGNEIVTLVNKVQSSGYYEITWNALNVPSGVYFCLLKAGNFSESKKLILLK